MNSYALRLPVFCGSCDHDSSMWLDDDELTAPAIVISSLGGLVHRKRQLTARDVSRARMLRQVLKTQLGPSRRLIPRAQDYGCSTDANNHSASTCEPVSQHRHLSTGQEQNAFLPPETSEASLSNPSNLLQTSTNTNAQASMLPPSSTAGYGNAARASRKRSWRAQGLLAGEWRDRFGRHRRAGHSVYHPDKVTHAGSSSLAADLSMASVPCSSASCAGTEVSFEGLIEELRKRLPNSSSSLLKMVAAQQNAESNASVYETTPNLLAREAGNNSPDREIGGEGGVEDADVEAVGEGRERQSHNDFGDNNNSIWSNLGDENIGEISFSPLRRRGTTRGNGLNNTQQRALPRGCLQLRPMVEPFKASPSRQPLSGVSGRLRQAVGSNPSLLLGSFSHGGGGNSKYDAAVTMHTAREENVSPSAAMVAAAKAQERALPLLQVCAMKLVEPARGLGTKAAIGGGGILGP